MFLHLYIILFTVGGDVSPGAVSVQGPSLLRGVSAVQGRSLLRGVSVRETPRTVTCGQYAYHWNAFLFSMGLGRLNNLVNYLQ